MTPESVGPLSRPVSVRHLPPEGLEVAVDATPEERAALAKDFKLEAIHALEGEGGAGLARVGIEAEHQELGRERAEVDLAVRDLVRGLVTGIDSLTVAGEIDLHLLRDDVVERLEGHDQDRESPFGALKALKPGG